MSELIAVQRSRAGLRWQLLATASVVTMAAIFPAQMAVADETGRPTVWIEGGWHFEAITGKNDPFVPPLDGETRALGLPSSVALQNMLAKTYGIEGSVSFQPSYTDWVFSVSARYGRSATTRNIHQEKSISGSPMKLTVQDPHHTGNIGEFGNIPVTPVFNGYALEKIDNAESHAILDFQVGKDLGIGLLGRGTDTVISFGARYAQFNYRSRVDSRAAPFASFEQYTTPGFIFHPKYKIHTYIHGSASYVERHTHLHAVGPSMSMSSTTGLIGQQDSGQLALDWGANAAILFGRQRVNVAHQATAQEFMRYGLIGPATVAPVVRTRSRLVTIPNFGGFAALSYRFPNAKLRVGYRGDFFFGAMDKGLDVRNSGAMGFQGPFATFSIGLGG